MDKAQIVYEYCISNAVMRSEIVSVCLLVMAVYGPKMPAFSTS
jgi:hypothetical protein